MSVELTIRTILGFGFATTDALRCGEWAPIALPTLATAHSNSDVRGGQAEQRHRGLLDAADGFAGELDEVVDGGAAGQQGELGDEASLERLAVGEQLDDLVGVGAAIEVGGEAREVLEGEGDEPGRDAALEGGQGDLLEGGDTVTVL